MPRVTSHPPAPPPLEPADVQALVNHLLAVAAWNEEDHREAQVHGHLPDAQSVENLRMYRLMALFLVESYDLPLPAGLDDL